MLAMHGCHCKLALPIPGQAAGHMLSKCIQAGMACLPANQATSRPWWCPCNGSVTPLTCSPYHALVLHMSCPTGAGCSGSRCVTMTTAECQGTLPYSRLPPRCHQKYRAWSRGTSMPMVMDESLLLPGRQTQERKVRVCVCVCVAFKQTFLVLRNLRSG